ncbi:MAG: hypothetical protein ACJAXA_001008 [Candidatus Aldehydirespiratoraceae bacterium]|jgi:hypothetical protein
MSDLAESTGPKAHARIVYLGPVSPHWEVYGDWGDRQTLDEFRARCLARLVLLPREDPQFRRNRERIVRDAEREMISIEWDLGVVVQRSRVAEVAASPVPDAPIDEVVADNAPAEEVTTEEASSDDAVGVNAANDESAAASSDD